MARTSPARRCTSGCDSAWPAPTRSPAFSPLARCSTISRWQCRPGAAAACVSGSRHWPMARCLKKHAPSAAASGWARAPICGLALPTSPALLLLDEPMAGMGDSTGMIALLDSLRNQLGIVLIEHDMHAVFQLADRISVLVSGRIIATGTAEQIRSDAQVRKAYLGDEAMA